MGGFHGEYQVVHSRHPDRTARIERDGRVRIPDFAMHEHLPIRSKLGLSDAKLADEPTFAGYDLVLARANSNVDEKDGKQSERDTYGYGSQEPNSHLRNGSIHQQQCAKNHHGNSADTQSAMSSKFGLQREQDERRDDQGHSGKAQREQIQRENSQYNKNEADHSGNDGSRMIELRVNGGSSDNEDQESDIGIHEEAENLFLERHSVVHDSRAAHVQRGLLSIKTGDDLAVHLFEKIVGIFRYVVDQVLLKSLLVGER